MTFFAGRYIHMIIEHFVPIFPIPMAHAAITGIMPEWSIRLMTYQAITTGFVIECSLFIPASNTVMA